MNSMTAHKVFLPALALLLSASAHGQGEANPSPLPAGLHSVAMQRPGEPAFHYALYIPRDYSSATPVPLVLALHYGVRGGEGEGAGRDLLRLLAGPALAELGAVIIAPDSLGGDWGTPQNEKAVIALLDDIEKRYAIDKAKVVVTGYSMGGAGTWHFAEKYPERFSAAIPVAGRPPASAQGWKLPVLAVHSHDDQIVPFGPAEARIAELKKAGVNARMIAVSGISHYETSRFRDALHQAVPWLKEVWK